jgi:hypothetical protein
MLRVWVKWQSPLPSKFHILSLNPNTKKKKKNGIKIRECSNDCRIVKLVVATVMLILTGTIVTAVENNEQKEGVE